MGWNLPCLVIFMLSVNYVASSNKNVVCYYGTWATYRSGLGKFDVENVNTELCTHLVYAFVGIGSDGTVTSLDPYLDLADNYGRDNFRKFNELKQANPGLKTLLAVGGWNEGSAKYSTMASTFSNRYNFMTSALKIILDYGFDGFDLDWEYPAQRDTVNGQADVNNFSQLVIEMRRLFSKYNLILTAAVASVEDSASLSYDVRTVCQNLDIVNLMTYDLYGSWDNTTGHNAALHRGEGDEDKDRKSLYTADVAVEYWLSQGCPASKLALGIPFYGHTFTLADPNVNGVRAPANGAGFAGPYTATSGTIGYNEFCALLQTETWNVRRDNLAKVPYASRGNQWVSYDDTQSIAAKVEYALSKNLGGVMVWSIETDDFNGVCGEAYPLLKAINRALGKVVEDDPDTTTTTTTTSTTTTIKPTPDPEPTTVADSCKQEGPVRDPENCGNFYICTDDGQGGFLPKQFVCPSGLYWDQENLICNYRELVTCNL